MNVDQEVQGAQPLEPEEFCEALSWQLCMCCQSSGSRGYGYCCDSLCSVAARARRCKTSFAAELPHPSLVITFPDVDLWVGRELAGAVRPQALVLDITEGPHARSSGWTPRTLISKPCTNTPDPPTDLWSLCAERERRS